MRGEMTGEPVFDATATDRQLSERAWGGRVGEEAANWVLVGKKTMTS